MTRDGARLRLLRAGDHAGGMALLETIPSLGRRILATLTGWFRETRDS